MVGRETDHGVTSGECHPAVAWGMRVKEGSWNLNGSLTKHRDNQECGGEGGERTIRLDVVCSVSINKALLEDWCAYLFCIVYG